LTGTETETGAASRKTQASHSVRGYFWGYIKNLQTKNLTTTHLSSNYFNPAGAPFHHAWADYLAELKVQTA